MKKKKLVNLTKKSDGKGFTLIELLAIIIVLSLIIVIGLGIGITTINNAKRKGYKITVNNIQNVADGYVFENSNNIVWLDKIENDNSKVFQCFRIQNLIDYGYFNSDLLNSKIDENRKVKSSDYIYVEMNNETKTIINKKIVFDSSHDELKDLCEDINKKMYIRASYVDGWAKEKDVSIEYVLLVPVSERKNYYYGYSFNNDDDVKLEDGVFNNKKEKEVVKVNKNGIINAIINNKNDIESVTEEIEVKGIDNEGPVVTSSYNGNELVKGSVIVALNVTDNGIGFDETSFSVDDLVVMVGDVELKEGIELVKIDDNNYNLIINNNIYSGEVKVYISEDKLFDKLENGNDNIELSLNVEFDRMMYQITYDANGGSGAPESQEKMYGVSIDLSDIKPIYLGYNFLGWSPDDPNATSAIYQPGDAYTLNADVTMYAVWSLNPLYSYNCKDDNGNWIYDENAMYRLTYTGKCKVFEDGGDNWKIKFLSSGNLMLLNSIDLDIFLVGGGGGGAKGSEDNYSGGGGGGGYTTTVRNINLVGGTNFSYEIIVGQGGKAGGGDGEASKFIISSTNIISASGGFGGTKRIGGEGGNKGGNGGERWGAGSNGGGKALATREFGEQNGDYYSGGGGGGGGGGTYLGNDGESGIKYSPGGSGGAGGGGAGGHSKGSYNGTAGKENFGGGGGGGTEYYNKGNKGSKGGAGIVIIRNARS